MRQRNSLGAFGSELTRIFKIWEEYLEVEENSS